jgi:hypothetical protein
LPSQNGKALDGNIHTNDCCGGPPDDWIAE